MSNDLRLLANPELEIYDLDADSKLPMALCGVPIGGQQVRYAIPKGIVPFIRMFNGNLTVNEVALKFCLENNSTWSKERLEELVNSFLLPKGVLLPEQKVDILNPQHKRAKNFLLVKLPLIPPSIVIRIAPYFKWAFFSKTLAGWIPIFIGMQCYFFVNLMPHGGLDFNKLDFAQFLELMLISTIAGFIHEFGHASAASNFGCKKLTIGWGIYMVYTVLWTDVSDAWKLPRKQRAVIDLGGIYFQSACLAALIVLYKLTNNDIYLYGYLFVDMDIAANLNPFLRLDGYWLVSDWFGLINLRQKQYSWLRSVTSMLRGNSKGTSTVSQKLGDKASLVLSCYSLLGAAFFVFVMWSIVQGVIIGIGGSYIGQVTMFWHEIISGKSWVTMVAPAVEILWRAILLIALGAMLLSWLKTAILATVKFVKSRVDYRNRRNGNSSSSYVKP